MATFQDCGHDDTKWVALSEDKATVIESAKILKELTAKVRKGNFVFTLRCLTCNPI